MSTVTVSEFLFFLILNFSSTYGKFVVIKKIHSCLNFLFIFSGIFFNKSDLKKFILFLLLFNNFLEFIFAILNAFSEISHAKKLKLFFLFKFSNSNFRIIGIIHDQVQMSKIFLKISVELPIKPSVELSKWLKPSVDVDIIFLFKINLIKSSVSSLGIKTFLLTMNFLQ